MRFSAISFLLFIWYLVGISILGKLVIFHIFDMLFSILIFQNPVFHCLHFKYFVILISWFTWEESLSFVPLQLSRGCSVARIIITHQHHLHKAFKQKQHLSNQILLFFNQFLGYLCQQVRIAQFCLDFKMFLSKLTKAFVQIAKFV